MNSVFNALKFYKNKFFLHKIYHVFLQTHITNKAKLNSLTLLTPVLTRAWWHVVIT